MELIKLPKSSAKFEEQIALMIDNIWIQFGMNPDDPRLKKYKPKDFAWTNNVKNAFYEIPFHKKLLKQLKSRELLTSWENCLPAIIDIDKSI